MEKAGFPSGAVRGTTGKYRLIAVTFPGTGRRAIHMLGFCMAYTETYHCDVCGNPRREAEDWWLALTEPASLIPNAPEQPMLRVTPWNIILSHAAKVRHLCGARCAQTLMDRWMRGE
jgi:hypothetical protein